MPETIYRCPACGSRRFEPVRCMGLAAARAPVMREPVRVFTEDEVRNIVSEMGLSSHPETWTDRDTDREMADYRDR